MEDGQDWEWEVLLPHSENHQIHHEHHNLSFSSLPNSEEEKEEEEGESSFPDGDVIHFDYFSIEYDYHHPSPNSEMETKTEMAFYSDISKQDVQCDDPQFGSGSWMDPSQFPRSNTSRVGKRRRNYSSSSESSDVSGNGSGSGSGSDSRNHLLIIQPHSDCIHQCSSLVHFHDRNYKEDLGSHTPEPSDRFSKCHLSSVPPSPQLQLGQNETGTGIGIEVEVESPSHSLSEKFDPHFNRGTQTEAQNKEQPDLSHGTAHSCNYSVIMNDEDEDLDVDTVVPEAEEKKSTDSYSEKEKRSVAWWRVPLEVLKYCVMRVSPVWSLPVAAAALMGFVLLRRRWFSKLKRKSQGLHLNITVDDKKVSQFMSRAARLNEAFSVVKRVPIIRPSLPAPGLAPWPMMSLR